MTNKTTDKILEEDMKTSFQFPELCSEILKERDNYLEKCSIKLRTTHGLEQRNWGIKLLEAQKDEFLVSLAINKATEKRTNEIYEYIKLHKSSAKYEYDVFIKQFKQKFVKDKKVRKDV